MANTKDRNIGREMERYIGGSEAAVGAGRGGGNVTITVASDEGIKEWKEGRKEIRPRIKNEKSSAYYIHLLFSGNIN